MFCTDCGLFGSEWKAQRAWSTWTSHFSQVSVPTHLLCLIRQNTVCSKIQVDKLLINLVEATLKKKVCVSVSGGSHQSEPCCGHAWLSEKWKLRILPLWINPPHPLQEQEKHRTNYNKEGCTWRNWSCYQFNQLSDSNKSKWYKHLVSH